jgi:hypothetical protein
MGQAKPRRLMLGPRKIPWTLQYAKLLPGASARLIASLLNVVALPPLLCTCGPVACGGCPGFCSRLSALLSHVAELAADVREHVLCPVPTGSERRGTRVRKPKEMDPEMLPSPPNKKVCGRPCWHAGCQSSCSGHAQLCCVACHGRVHRRIRERTTFRPVALTREMLALCAARGMHARRVT